MNNFQPPAAQKVLILAPHPDDEALACSGTILLYSSKGIGVDVVYVSNGEKSDLKLEDIAGIRKSEAVLAGEILGVKNTIFLEFPDEHIGEHKNGIIEKLHGIVDDSKPDLVFAPNPFDPHPDHLAISEVALELMRELQSFRLAFYEVYHPIRFNILVDISSVVDKKERAIFSYKRSLFDIPEVFWHAIEGLNLFRSIVHRREGFYEAFWLIDKSVSDDEIVKWAAFDREIPEQMFLSKLKFADELMHEVQLAHASLHSKDEEVSSLKRSLQELSAKLPEKEVEVQRLGSEVQQLRNELRLIKDGFFWRFIERFYATRDRLLPEGTLRRDFYDRASSRIKKMRERLQ